MHFFVAVTDKNWFQIHASRSQVEEVNFWRPSSQANFKILQAGEPLLFKLHSPQNFIVGGGFFARFLKLPVNLAWDTFGISNGVTSLTEMRERIGKYRKIPIGQTENPIIGCIMLAEPFFWPEDMWIPIPSDFSLHNVQGKSYDAEVGSGYELWQQVAERIQLSSPPLLVPGTATMAAIDSKGFGKPQIKLPRLGQGLFRALLTDVYERRCAITGERTMPVLDAAHIKPYTIVQRHELWNGLLLRTDLHRLFEGGYITVDPKDRRVVVSNRIRVEFDNGQEYYRLAGQVLREPIDGWARPTSENLDFHAYSVFR